MSSSGTVLSFVKESNPGTQRKIRGFREVCNTEITLPDQFVQFAGVIVFDAVVENTALAKTNW